ncbi:MAG: carboxypeptidase-like regulatory domain-containing protein [Pyrinomonadaceae bacterium]
MKKLIVLLAVVLVTTVAVAFWTPLSQTLAQMDVPFFEREPDMPVLEDDEEAESRGGSKEEYLARRAEAYSLLRGIDGVTAVDPQLRVAAVKELEKEQERQSRLPDSSFKDALLADWTPIGPAPLFLGNLKYSGRTTAIAVHPTNPDIVYSGTAQGGVYRSINGGTTWTPIMDNALSLAVGALSLAPSNPEILYVGTGEPNFSADSFFGVGVYRIDNASTMATLSGPLNRDAGNVDVITGRSVSEVVVHPTDPDIIFVSTTSGTSGSGGTAYTPLPQRGLYRSTNATSATPTFTRLTGLAGNLDASVRDIAIDPTNPNILIAGIVSSTVGGIHRSADALSANPTFTQVFAYTGTTTSELNTELTSIHPAGAGDAVFYAASGQGTGRVLRSTDGGVTWTQRVANNFCNPQCFYNIAIAVDPVNPDQVYLGGSPSVIAAFSTNGGTSFTEGGSGVHVDSHVLTVSKSNPTIIYLGTDGGVYKSTNSGASFVDLNTSQYSATQFTGLAVHPTDPTLTIGGTQDNGTNQIDTGGTQWNRVDGGDGGNSIIDTNAVDTTNVRMYHTFQNQLNNIVGYRTRGTTTAAWVSRGCTNGTSPNNNINCGDTAVLFYAPFEAGPGNPNSIYYATDRIYRSGDLGVTHTVVSQAPIQSGVAVSSIGISSQNDNVRIFGLRTGGLFGTTTGSSTLVDLDPNAAVPSGFISRTVVDPNNVNTAYVTIANYAVNNVWKTTNLNASPPTWTNISGTLPRVPVSAFLVDPANANILYAGTDIGVYVSADGGTTWNSFGTALPRVAVFDIAKTGNNLIRIATHGRGMYQIAAFSPAAVPVTIGGRVTTPTGLGLRNATVVLTDSLGVRQTATTSSFGIYSFANVTTGQSYFIGVSSKRYRFTTQNINVTAALSNVDFVGLE